MTNLEVLEECAKERLPQIELEARRLRDNGQRAAATLFERKASRVRVALHFLGERRKAKEETALGLAATGADHSEWAAASPVEIERAKRLGAYE